MAIILAIRSFFFILGKLKFVLLLIAAGFIAFYINDQGQDMIAAFDRMPFFHPYQFFFLCFLFIWANTVWNVSRVLLNSANLTSLIQKPAPSATITLGKTEAPPTYIAVTIDEHYARTVYSLYKWIPRFLIFTPYLIFIAAWVRENGSMMPGGAHESPAGLIALLLSIVHFFLITYRLALLRKDEKHTAHIPIEEIMGALREEKGFLASLRESRVRIIAVLTLLATVAVFIYGVVAAFFTPVIEKGKPGLIILSALIVYTVVCFLVSLAGKRLKIPLFTLLFILVFVFAGWNNNHRVEHLSSQYDQQLLHARNSFMDTAYVDAWIRYKLQSEVLNDSGSMIYLVAAEGGGIRNCYWTATVLKELQRRQPRFYSQTFAATGASGGDVGLGFYYGYLYQHRKAFDAGGQKATELTRIGLDTICSADFLSRLSFGFLYNDFWQRFLPFPVQRWDRGNYLAQSFDAAFSASLTDGDTSVLGQNYLEAWSDTDRYRYPVILFNSHYVEKGTKAVFAPFRLSQRYYFDALDVLSVTQHGVSFRECMLSTARFPFVTPPGLLKYGNEESFGHLIDGGGFDNKAIQTAEQTATLVHDRLRLMGLHKIKVQIIYIGYGTQPLVPGRDAESAEKPVASYQQPLGRDYELAPLIGGYNTIFRWIYSAHGLTTHLDPRLNVIDFGLRSERDSSRHRLPLGWYLSPYSRKLIQEELKATHLQQAFARVDSLNF